MSRPILLVFVLRHFDGNGWSRPTLPTVPAFSGRLELPNESSAISTLQPPSCVLASISPTPPATSSWRPG